MKTTITNKDEIDSLPDSDQGNDIRKMLSSPLRIGSSQYLVQKLTYDDGMNEQGEAVNFPSIEISAVFLSPFFAPSFLTRQTGSLKANAQIHPPQTDPTP